MKRKEITESNKIIAKFMIGEQLKSFANTEDVLKSGFKYHSDWNYLMAVVEKIESLGYCVKITTGMIAIKEWLSLSDSANIEYSGSKLHTVYNSCVQFIKWHNEKGGAL